MIEVTGTAQQDAWAAGVLPPVEKVAPGLWSVPLPLPMVQLRYVLCYVLELDDGVALVDAGWDTPGSWRALTTGLAEIGYAPHDVRGVLVTHVHPDHYGMAGRIREVSDAWLALHPAEAATLPAGHSHAHADAIAEQTRHWLQTCGVPSDQTVDMGASAELIRPWLRSYGQPDVLLEHGDRAPLESWDVRAVWTPGHTPGHLCFHLPDARLLLSGDHVLPRISPNVSVQPQQASNPLGDFLDSIGQVSGLDVDEVLPGHEYRFRGLTARAAQITGHHDQRLDEVAAAVAATPGATAWELTERLTWSRSWAEIIGYMRRAALGEALAHLTLLEHRGRLVRRAGVPERWYPAP